jgi:DNA repair photolyase
MPGINDRPEQVAPILEAAREAGAAYVTGIGLHLRKGVREVFFEWLEEERPDLVERYRRLYRRGAYLPQEERRRLSSLVRGPELSPGQRMRGSTAPRQIAPKPERAQKEVQERLF